MSLSGPDRIRLAIRRDRGEFAPSGPVTLCGQPDGTEVRSEPVQPLWRTCAHRFRRRARNWWWRPRQCSWCGIFEQDERGGEV